MHFLKHFKSKYLLNFQKSQEIDEIKHLLDTIDNFIKDKKYSEQIIFLDYIIKSLVSDACTSKIVEPLLKATDGILEEPLPLYYYDNEGKSKNIYTDNKVSVDLSTTNIYVRPWNLDKTLDNLINLSKKSFVYKENNHFSYYYSDINLCYVHNGNHSINAGRYYKKGVILSEEVNVSLLYSNIDTDGIYWYNIHTGQVIYEVSDFRFAAVFLVAKKRFELTNKIKSTKI